MEYNGIELRVSEKPAHAGIYNEVEPGALLILGASKLVWEDYFKARALFDKKRDYDIMAINDIASLFKAEHVNHICSVHQKIPGLVRELREVRIAGFCHTHAPRYHEGVDMVWGELTRSGGTSAMFAVKIAIAMGYKKIILCGCGLDKTGHFYDPENPEDNKNSWFDEACRAPWKDFRKDNAEAKRRVRVMSGELKELYGEPAKDWIYEGVLSGVR